MDKQLLDILSAFFMAIAVVVLPVLARYVALWFKAKIAEAEAALKDYNPDLEYLLSWAADLAVSAAESSGLNGWIEDKKQFALDIASRALAEKGLDIDVAVLEAAIEKAWLEAYGQEKLEAAKS